MQEMKIFAQLKDININVVIIGLNSTGKTSILKSLLKAEKQGNQTITEGVDYLTISVTKRNQCIKYNFRDCGGQPEFWDKTTAETFKNASVAIAVCSIEDRPQSIRLLETNYLPKLRKFNRDCKIHFVCNKIDLDNQECYKDKYKEIMFEFNRINDNNGNIFKPIQFVSAKEGTNITEVINQIIMEDAISELAKDHINKDEENEIRNRCKEIKKKL